MKGKITIVLLGLALVFGMIAASCDNGAYPTRDDKDESTQWAYDGRGNDKGIPDFEADGKTPKFLSGSTVIGLLDEYKDVSVDDKIIRTKKYIITKVAPNTGAADPDAKVKALYAGMSLLIVNPN